MAQVIGTMKVLCGLKPGEQVNLDSFNGRQVTDRNGVIVGTGINARIEENCVVVDVVRTIPPEKSWR